MPRVLNVGSWGLAPAPTCGGITRSGWVQTGYSAFVDAGDLEKISIVYAGTNYALGAVRWSDWTKFTDFCAPPHVNLDRVTYRAQLDVFDVSDPANPAYSTSLALSFDGLVAEDYYDGCTVYHEIPVPTWGSMCSTNDHTAERMYIRQAYSGGPPGQVDQQRIDVIDVSAPGSPSLLAAVDPGFLEHDDGAYLTAFTSNGVNCLAVLALTPGGTYLRILDFTIPAAPVQLVEFDLSLFTAYDAGYFSGGYLYIGVGDVMIYDLRTPDVPASIAYVGSYSAAPDTLYTPFVDSNVAYVPGDTYLYVLNVANPAAPVLLGTSADVYSIVYKISANCAFGYTSSGSGIIDISNPAALSVGTTIDMNAGNPAYHQSGSVEGLGSYLYDYGGVYNSVLTTLLDTMIQTFNLT